MRLLFIVEARHVRRHWRRGENTREVEALRLPMLDALARVEQLGSADELVQGPYAELRHQLARLLGDVEEVVYHVLGLAFELRSDEHTSELESQSNLVCRLLLENKKIKLS